MKRFLRSATRREFISSGASAAALALWPGRLFAQDALTQKLAADPLRPQFHLLPARNWMNDPNGPIYIPDSKGGVNGQYHMFFQYNPLGPTWGDMSWNHAVSPDMVHWKLLPVALTPTPNSADSFGVFSGSALRMDNRVYQVYTGTEQGPKEMATIAGDANNIQESQCLAYSDDPRLVTWTKLPKPIIPMPPPGMKITGFRDPSAWKQGEWYYMTVGAGEENVGGCVLLYRSKAIDHGWEYLHKLTGGAWNVKKTLNPCDDGEMWECPDFFALDGQHLLIYSTLGKVYWQSGEFDEKAMRFTPRKTGLLDLGAFYAPKTQLDAQGRRILWGWIQEKRSEDAMRAAGWSGMMSLPRMLNLDKDGTLRITTPQQVNVLRGAAAKTLPGREGIAKILPKASGEALYSGTKDVAFKLWMSTADGVDLLSVKYVPETHTFLVDGREVMLQPDDAPSVHAYVDGSVIEVILGERIGYTKRFYYASPTAPDITIVANGSKATLEAWEMSPISANRLTSPA